MTKDVFRELEGFMLSHMTDAAHDKLHIYRVLYTAVDIAAATAAATAAAMDSEEGAIDMDVLIAACILHDIGRDRQYRDPALCHAREGAEMAFAWLIENGWPEDKAAHIRDAISTHRFRGGNPPRSLEAKILYDADKLDATGTMAVARSLFYSAITGEPLYVLDGDGNVRTDPRDEPSSFFQEYNFKLRKVYGRFHTARGRELAESRREAGDSFYDNMLREVRESHEGGRALLDAILREREATRQ